MSEDSKRIGAAAPVVKSSDNDRKAPSAASPVDGKKKVVIKSADMKEDMQMEAIDIAINAFEKNGVEKDVAEHIKKEFDQKHDPTWHCIVGKNFEMTTGSRTKRARESTNPSSHATKRARESTNPSSHAALFVSQEAQEKFRAYGKQVVAKVVNEDSRFGDHGLRVDLLLRAQGLDKFLAISSNIYPTLLKYFYANLRKHETPEGTYYHNVLATRVKNVSFTFSKSDIANCFELTTFDEAFPITSENDILRYVPAFEVQNAVNDICLNKNNVPKNLSVTLLKLDCRIIHRIIAYCLEGKSSGTEKLTGFEIFLTWAIYSNIKIDWPHFIFTKIAQGPPRSDSALNYGFAISKLLISKGVDVTNEDVRPFRRQSDLLQDSNIRNMGYDVIDGKWEFIRGQPSVGASTSTADAPRRSRARERDTHQMVQEVLKKQLKIEKLMKKLAKGISKIKRHFNLSSSSEDSSSGNEEGSSTTEST